MTDNAREVYAGVDTHLDVHVAAVIDHTGRLLGTKAFPTSPLGLQRLERWLTSHGQVRKIGVEGTGSYGLGLTRVLTGAGHTVIEVNRPNRQLRRTRGKSDTVDAEAAARAVLAGHAVTVPKTHDGIVEAIRVLRLAAKSTRGHMSQIESQIGHLILTAPDHIRVDLQQLTARKRAQHAAGYRPGTDTTNITNITNATKTALRTLARQWLTLDTDHKKLTTELITLTEHANPALLALPGVGPDTAAALLIAAGDNPERLTSSAAFAALCGVNPIEASSGKTQGRRLNGGGNRQANSALHRIVLVRMSRHHEPTMTYINRRTAEGLSKRDIMRCLKRYVAREVFQQLQHPQPAIARTTLRPRRQALHLPLRAAADHLQRPINAIARIENGTVHDPELTHRYHQWLTTQETA
jgi:transposase